MRYVFNNQTLEIFFNVTEGAKACKKNR